MRMERNFWLTVLKLGSRHNYAVNGMIFDFLAQIWVCLVVIGGAFSSKMKMASFFAVTIRFSCNAMCAITTKQHNCRFEIVKKNIQHLRAGFALFTVVATGCFLFETKHTFRFYMSDNTQFP